MDMLFAFLWDNPAYVFLGGGILSASLFCGWAAAAHKLNLREREERLIRVQSGAGASPRRSAIVEPTPCPAAPASSDA